MRRRVRSPAKEKPSTLTSKVLGSGDVLLTRKLPFARPLPSRALPSTSPLPHGDFLLRHAAFRRAVVDSDAAEKRKDLTEINLVGDLVLATSASRLSFRQTAV